ncbi:MAG TPA: hypothetical protein PKA27_07485 [Fimbriimonadaceae bacterium]|nr:hypothetical protein [Fimbriimonadaceae bacterium]
MALGVNDPGVVEAFLFSRPDVLNASAWVDHGNLQAFVEVAETSEETERTLRTACAKELGFHLTPSHIQLASRARFAA